MLCGGGKNPRLKKKKGVGVGGSVKHVGRSRIQKTTFLTENTAGETLRDHSGDFGCREHTQKKKSRNVGQVGKRGNISSDESSFLSRFIVGVGKGVVKGLGRGRGWCSKATKEDFFWGGGGSPTRSV